MNASKHILSPIAVYCGASVGTRPAYAAAAAELGRLMAARGIGLVYGGGRIGMMGIVADTVMAGGGGVVGIITNELMKREVGHTGVPDLRIVETMHERKKTMADLARAFIALPGGVGTLDELFEILAWRQLGIHQCPIGILNTEGFYDDILRWIDRANRENFLRLDVDRALIVETDPERLLDKMAGR